MSAVVAAATLIGFGRRPPCQERAYRQRRRRRRRRRWQHHHQSSGGRVVVAAEAQHSKEEEDRADGDTSELRAARRRGRAWSGGVAVVCATSIATASPMVSAMGIASVASSSLAWAFAGTMAGAAALGHLVVPQLQRIKFGQVVRDDGPATHFSKVGTPTAGGVFFVPVALAATLALAPGQKETLAAVAAVTIVFLLGLYDDCLKLLRRNTRGVTARQKIMVQSAAGALFGAVVTELATPLAGIATLFSAFIFAAEANGANLTDGLDGLCAGVSALGLTCMAVVGLLVALSYGWDARVLCFPIFGAAMAGSCVGFLHHNSFPARSFMGDAGSMAIGATFAVVGLGPFLLGFSGRPLAAAHAGTNIQALFVGLLFGVSLLFAVECISVIIQVGYYKWSGRTRRIFLMAPIHHHFELKHSWHETQVVWRFYVAQAICAAVTGAVVAKLVF